MSEELQSSYDRVAENYAANFRHELEKKPFDRKMLDWLVEKVGEAGVIADVGCGPAQVAGYLHQRGAEVCGIDLSPEMVRQAQILHPEIPFQQADMLDLAHIADNSWGGIAAFYSIVHLPRRKVSQALQEFNRVLRSSGVLLLAFHLGREIKHLDEFLDNKVSLDFFFFETGEIKDYLRQTGFVPEEVIERDPYSTDVEYQSRRAYIFARKP